MSYLLGNYDLECNSNAVGVRIEYTEKIFPNFLSQVKLKYQIKRYVDLNTLCTSTATDFKSNPGAYMEMVNSYKRCNHKAKNMTFPGYFHQQSNSFHAPICSR